MAFSSGCSGTGSGRGGLRLRARGSRGVRVVLLVAALAACVPATTLAQSFALPPLSDRAVANGVQVTRDEGIEFVTIRPPAVGTGGYTPIPGPGSDGRTNFGTVTQPYRIARTELTSDVYLDFLNSLGQMPPDDPALRRALFVGGSNTTSWEGLRDRSYPDPGFRFYLPNPETDRRIPVLGLNWRFSAVLCNWLHHGRTTNPQHLLSGAYDITTFGDGPDGTFTDQLTRSPGARFWIPSQAEWLTAAHFDPSKTGPGGGGWWQFPTSSDTRPISGAPGTPGAQTSAGTFLANSLGVGAYPTVQSPWGLLDTSGSGLEWTETAALPSAGFPGGPVEGPGLRGRVLEGASSSSLLLPHINEDLLSIYRASPPDDSQTEVIFGLRIAAAIPTPTTSLCFLCALAHFSSRTRKELEYAHQGSNRHSRFDDHNVYLQR